MKYNLGSFAPATDANKYSRGKLIVIAGSDRYPGAAVLAARASQRMGAGYTEVVTAKKAVEIVRLSSPSLVVGPLSRFDIDKLPTCCDERPCAVCIGPGFEGSKDEADLVVRVLGKARCPVLVDGGALSTLASKRALKRLARRSDNGLPTVITPHAGEAKRLAKPFGLKDASPEKLAYGLALALHAVVVLKGPDTVVSDGSAVEWMREGTAALAKAGTGDVLAGMIAALLAQGGKPFDAALEGATVHAHAGLAAAARLTEVCVCAEDVIESIPEALRVDDAISRP